MPRKKRDELLDRIEEIAMSFSEAQQDAIATVVRHIKHLVIEDRERDKLENRRRRRRGRKNKE